MDKKTAYLQLKKFCLDLGLDLFGVADINEIKKDFMLSQEITSGLDRAVCIGLGLSGKILEGILGAPTQLYFYHYKTVNMFLDQSALRISGYIQSSGYDAVPIPSSQIVDWKGPKAHLSHRHVGHLAGLGWLGRNNLLVNDKLGSKFRLTTILTNMPLEADKPSQKECGACRLCIDACPAQAIKENRADFDHLKCFEQLKEFQKQRKVDQYVCGICVKTCVPASIKQGSKP